MRFKFGKLGANFWARGFLRNCRKVMTPLVDDMPALEANIRRSAQALFDEDVGTLPDKQARVFLAMCSLVLASFRELKKLVGETAAFDAVRRTFAMTGAKPMTSLVRLWLWWFRDPVGYLQKRRPIGGFARRMYGKSMEFDEEYADDRADMLVKRCMFHAFFVRHAAPELTPLICAWDRGWMDAIDRSSRPIRTERLSTISTGGDCCRFRFVRDADKSAKDASDVVLVTLQARGD
jgi:hypothetical protein